MPAELISAALIKTTADSRNPTTIVIIPTYIQAVALGDETIAPRLGAVEARSLLAIDGAARGCESLIASGTLKNQVQLVQFKPDLSVAFRAGLFGAWPKLFINRSGHNCGNHPLVGEPRVSKESNSSGERAALDSVRKREKRATSAQRYFNVRPSGAGRSVRR